jgi:glycosyl transferase, family 25
MKTVFSAFDLIRIINLPARLDRRRQMEAELRCVGLGNDDRVAFVDAIASDTAAPWRLKGERGIFLSHLKVLREAAARDSSVLILEDDADFTDAVSTTEIAEDVSIFYGGYEASDPGNLQSSDIVGAHCMGFSAETVSALVPFLEELFHHPSPPPIDGAYVWFRRANPGVKTLFADPVVAVQRSSRSDIAQLRFYDRWPVLREAVGFARRGLRATRRGAITFGLREAIVLAIIGTAIAIMAAMRNG